MTAPVSTHPFEDARGISILELLIVIAMISVITGFAVIKVAEARQDMTRENAAVQLAAYLEKARVDSVRRHPTTAVQMAQVSILDANSYSVTIDSDWDGALDAPRVISVPAGSGLQFNTPYPRTIYFNWRGRTVDAAGNPATPDFVSLTHSYGTSRIDLTPAGQPSLVGAPVSSPVVNSAAPTPSLRSTTQVP
ncbi:MAG TPA: type II secretion system protein [Pyrinomonadaceae bacterium]|nr:type II secretion system protein [Pyrinomonadaceae bacterium]